MSRHIKMGPMFTSDSNKSKKENEKAIREHYKERGVDIDEITPEEEKAILDMAKRHGFMDTP